MSLYEIAPVEAAYQPQRSRLAEENTPERAALLRRLRSIHERHDRYRDQDTNGSWLTPPRTKAVTSGHG